MNPTSPPISFSQLSRIHCIGIGGMVMSGLAQLLHARGKKVNGSDEHPSERTRMLSRMGIVCAIGAHDTKLVPHTDCVIVSPSIPRSHPELLCAQQWGIPVLQVFEFLGLMSKCYTTIAVAGCHGKTTVSAYLGTILEKANMDPSVLLRTEVEVWNTNVRVGRGEYLVLEADDNEKRFLTLSPQVGIIMNIEADHLEYFKHPDALIRAYRQFARISVAQGTLVANFDDKRAVHALRGIKGNIIWFGRSEGAHVRALNVAVQEGITSFMLHIKCGEKDEQFELAVPGSHQISNALAVAAGCLALNLPLSAARETLASYHGGKRHLEMLGKRDTITVIDDAADHPSKIRAVLKGVRDKYQKRPIWCVFQPYSLQRAKHLAEDISRSFIDADAVILLPIVEELGDKKDTSFSIHDLLVMLERYHTHVGHAVDQQGIQTVLKKMPHDSILITLGAEQVREVAETFLNA